MSKKLYLAFPIVIITSICVALIVHGSHKSTASAAFFHSQQACEQQTGKSCVGPLQCDVASQGQTLEQTCGKGFFKGAWQAKP